MKANKPRIIVNCIASHYACDNERIIEYSLNEQGGLISLRNIEGKLHISLYRHEKDVKITISH